MPSKKQGKEDKKAGNKEKPKGKPAMGAGTCVINEGAGI